MHYFSTNRTSAYVSFREAVLKGQPDDKGLYFPSAIPQISGEWLKDLVRHSNEQVAFDVIRPFVGGDIADETLFEICSETVDFDFPLVPVTENISALELFHGPTLAFKDVGARFMSRCLRYFSRDNTTKTIVVVATSGDTGGAVAAGFHGIEGIDVVILYPKGRVSKVQELQLTTLGGNVTTLELHGSFDDCQALAKQALADTDLQSRVHLTSANSINVARWLPQQFYYFFAMKQWASDEPVISVPSGNFGNLASGILAHISGLPVKRFIAACNANDVVARYLDDGDYKVMPSVATLSNAMDVGAPSNFVRVLEIFNNNFIDLKAKLGAVSISDEETATTMREVYRDHNYVLDPHGAVGYRALADYLEHNPGQSGFFLETAHPVKFDSVNEIIGTYGEVPPAVSELFLKEKTSYQLHNDYAAFKDILISKI
jgi:threonine synthase